MIELKHLLIGGGSIGAIQLLDAIPTDPNDLMGIAKIAVQIIIGIVALIKMFKKPKN